MAEGALSLEQAVRTIDAARQYEEPLRRRTEGVTWVLWGFVTFALLSFGSALELLRLPFSSPAYYLYPFALLGLGIAGTKAVWSIAGVSLPATRAGTLRSAAGLALAVAVVIVVFTLTFYLVPVRAMPAFILFGLGTPWLVLGTLNPQRASRTGRIVMIASGAAMYAATLALLSALPEDHDVGFHLMAVMGAAVGGGAPILGGVWQALRG
jgi:hypothetical protein